MCGQAPGVCHSTEVTRHEGERLVYFWPPLKKGYLIFLQSIGTLYLTTVVFQKAVIFLIHFDGSTIRQLLCHNHSAKLFLKCGQTTGARDARWVQTVLLVDWNTHIAMSLGESVFEALPLCWNTPGQSWDLSFYLGSAHEAVHSYQDTHVGAQERAQALVVWTPICVSEKSEVLRANKPSDGNNTALEKQCVFGENFTHLKLGTWNMGQFISYSTVQGVQLT